jgi:hypothetical protein
MTTLEKKSPADRNQTGRPGITTDARPRRESEPGSPQSSTHSPARGAAALPTPQGAAPRRDEYVGSTRRGPRCEDDRPAFLFVLLTAPHAAHWAVRRWCGDCLLRRGHIRAHELAAAHAAERKRLTKLRRKADYLRAERERAEKASADLIAKAKADPVFAEALLRASTTPAVREAARSW